MRIRTMLILLFMFLVGAVAHASTTDKVYKLWDSEPNPDKGRPDKKTQSRLWQSRSYPIGNGYMGACLFGRTDTERIQITDKTLSNAGKYGWGGLTSFAEVYLDFNHSDPKNYSRTLHLNDAMFRVKYEHEGVEYYRECFASYPDNIMVVKLTANKPGKVSFKLRPENPFLRDTSDKYARSGEVVAKNDQIRLYGTIPFFSCNYEAQIKVLNRGGKLSTGKDTITVANADSVVLLIAVGTNYELSSRVFKERTNSKKLDADSFPHAKVTERIRSAEKKGFDQLRSDHLVDYQNLFSRTQVDFGREVSPLPTKELLAEYKQGKTDAYLEELFFQYGRYLLIASSRKGTLPTGLQGVWTPYIETPWTGGYWHNINVQMNYWGACSANLAETFLPYIEYFQAYWPEAQKKATEYISKNNKEAFVENENGWTIGTGASPYTIQSPGGHSGPGTVGFTSKLFWDYYDFTRDEHFLSEIGYPTLLGASRFLSKTLKPSPDGLLLVNPSASPEQKLNGKISHAEGTTFDQGFVWENHNDVLKAAAVLGIQNNELALFKDQMTKLDPILIGDSGQVKEYREENEYGDIGGKDHRHISHLCPLYPGTLINATTPEWLDAAKYSLDRRGTTRGGKGVTTGWALAHRMNLRARTKDGNEAYEVYKLLIQNRVLDNLWALHPPFQIDANLGGMAGVAEMLLQSHEGYIAPLPALPTAWENGKFSGLVARGNFVVSAEWTKGRAKSFKVLSKKGGQCIIKYPGVAQAQLTNEKGVKVPFNVKAADQVEFSTQKGMSYGLMMAIPDSGCAVEPLPENEADYQQRMEWFADAKFGLFIHYGIYSTLGGEWKGQPVKKFAEWIQRWGEITPEEYIPLAADFSPDALDADAWVKRAKDAGMKYVVITTKHHEGFCLWDSALTEYDLGEATDFDRDILGELKAACDKHGLQFGTYYSIIDWHHPSQRAQQARPRPLMNDKEGYVAYMKGQLKELIERYDPAVMWFDGDWTHWWTLEDGIDLYNYLRELSPDMVINHRVAKRKTFDLDFVCQENRSPGGVIESIWEGCWTVNHSWGYKKSDTNWKSTEVLIQKLIDINANGGNLLLNVGPHADGSWPDMSIQLLKEMGVWTSAHSEALYGAEYISVPEQFWGRVAQAKGSSPDSGSLFLYIFDWPDSGKITLQDVRFEQVEARDYAGREIPFTNTAEGVELDLSSVEKNPYATVLRVSYKEMSVNAASKSEYQFTGNETVLQAKDAKLNGRRISFEKNSHIGFWTNPEDTATWILNVPAPETCRVKALYSCEKEYAGSDVQLTIGESRLTATVKPTKNWDTYRVLDLGVIELNQVGTFDCKMGFGKTCQPALFNLKSLIFEPVGE